MDGRVEMRLLLVHITLVHMIKEYALSTDGAAGIGTPPTAGQVAKPTASTAAKAAFSAPRLTVRESWGLAGSRLPILIKTHGPGVFSFQWLVGI
jgi:hypothetical protein